MSLIEELLKSGLLSQIVEGEINHDAVEVGTPGRPGGYLKVKFNASDKEDAMKRLRVVNDVRLEAVRLLSMTDPLAPKEEDK